MSSAIQVNNYLVAIDIGFATTTFLAELNARSRNQDWLAHVYLSTRPQLIKEREHPLTLLLREAIQALVLRIVHIVVNAVLAWLIRTSVRRSRATLGWKLLRRRVANIVTSSRARATLEDVEETEPLRNA